MSASGDGGGGSDGPNDAPAKLPGEAEVLNEFPELKDRSRKKNNTTGIKGLSWSSEAGIIGLSWSRRDGNKHRCQFRLNEWDGSKLQDGSGKPVGIDRQEAVLLAVKNLLGQEVANQVETMLEAVIHYNPL